MRNKGDRGKKVPCPPLLNQRGKFFSESPSSINPRISPPPLPDLMTKTESCVHVLASKEVCLVAIWHFQSLMQSTYCRQGRKGREMTVVWEHWPAMANAADYFQRLLSSKVQIL